ncbi:protein MRG1-like isoform X2 [Andrographis paniculata]|uniref:protein MRG1-like isoform X2 n=1 Tax=Andrographis paniculata TaxID=175694 RepID=UPI0021E95C8A|nr:protein MRG1-like isoform X2 [Andrographis paniculata]
MKEMNSAGGTKGSTSVSAGATVDKSMKEEDVDSSPFHEGEKVLGFHGPCLYDAKGWNKHWDEWLGVDSLLKRTEENVQKQKELKEMHSRPGRLSQDKTKTPAGVRGRKRKNETVDKEVAPPVEKVNIQIPSTLKRQLVDDHECIIHLGKLVKLPCSPNVHEILSKFLDFQMNKDGIIVDPVVEVVDGLRSYFDKALPVMLLYKQERRQYREAITDNLSPSSVYGAEHLLRLFVKLPELLSCMHIEKEALTELQQRLHDILRFLQNNQCAFFLSNYEKPPSSSSSSDGSPTTVKQEDDK